MQDFLKQIIKEAGAIAKEFFLRGVTPMTKGHPHDFLSEADLMVSEFLVSKINAQYPTHHIKSEEMADDINVNSEYEWVIDPIDGTWGFVHGIPVWAVMVAVLQDNKPLMSAVYFPMAEQLFFAEIGKGAYLNDKQIHVKNTELLDGAYGILQRRSKAVNLYGDYFERYRVMTMRAVQETNMVMVNFANAANMCYLASGALDYVIANSGLDWDRLPVYLICTEAGAVVTDSDGNPWKRGRQDIVAANQHLHTQLLSLFKN